MNCMNTKYMKGRNRKPGGNKRQLFLQTDKRRKLPQNIVYGVEILKEQSNKKKVSRARGLASIMREPGYIAWPHYPLW